MVWLLGVAVSVVRVMRRIRPPEAKSQEGRGISDQASERSKPGAKWEEPGATAETPTADN
jgi:hypothetical protein